MKLFVEIHGRNYEVDLIEEAGERKLWIDGKRIDVDYREADNLGQLIVMMEGRSYGLSIEGDTQTAHVTLAGHSYAVHMEDDRERAANLAAREAAGGGGPIEAVMPGIVVEVLVEEGQAVEAGAPLLILEAMKMQNEIKAPGAGTVSEVRVKAGETVASGAVLVVLQGNE
ncbi:MAG: biotin/lipoyl-binding protein [Planctomycetes bacterium]|nr:biotin/lipoyl-binding protein [Planctomycetota bacterium]